MTNSVKFSSIRQWLDNCQYAERLQFAMFRDSLPVKINLSFDNSTFCGNSTLFNKCNYMTLNIYYIYIYRIFRLASFA